MLDFITVKLFFVLIINWCLNLNRLEFVLQTEARVFYCHFQQYFSYIGGGNWRKPQNCRNILTNFIT